tara:strand:+ start:816 stop:1091 length:276 start_codon:yes stop_codon:yes gene_type:complete
MEIFELIEKFGLPVIMVVALGFYVQKQNKWIQETLMQEMEESQNRMESIMIKLIDQQKALQTDTFPELHKELARLQGSFNTLQNIMTKLRR